MILIIITINARIRKLDIFLIKFLKILRKKLVRLASNSGVVSSEIFTLIFTNVKYKNFKANKIKCINMHIQGVFKRL